MSATDIVSTTPPLALPGTSVPIGSARPLTDWVVGRTLAAPGMGTAVFADGAVWAVDRKDGGFTGDVPNGDIYRIDPASGKTTATVEHARGGFPTVGLGAIWLVNAEFGQTVTRVDLKTLKADRFRTSTTEDPVPEAVVVAHGNVWVGNNHDGTVAVVDPATLTVTRTIRLTEPGGFGVRGKAATDGTSVWFGISRTGEIVRIDAATATEVSRIRLPQVPHTHLPEGLAATDASVPEQLVVVGDRLYASTVNHLYAIDISTIGSERIVADLAVDDPAATVITPGEHGDLWALVRGPGQARPHRRGDLRRAWRAVGGRRRRGPRRPCDRPGRPGRRSWLCLDPRARWRDPGPAGRDGRATIRARSSGREGFG